MNKEFYMDKKDGINDIADRIGRGIDRH